MMIEIATQSVQAVRGLLLEIIEAPKKFASEDQIMIALKSQGALAKLKDATRRIVPCSLNTQKTAAERVFDNGYCYLDLLRNNALQAIDNANNTSKSSNKTTRAGQKKKIAELEHDIALLEQQNIMLIALVQNLKHKLELYANSDSKQLQANLRQDLIEIRAKVSFTNNASLINKVFGNG